MKQPAQDELDALWSHHHAEWRDPAQIAGQWHDATPPSPELLLYQVHGPWWETLAAAGITLLVSREYEHLVMALGSSAGQPAISYLRLPHPSGIAVDRERGVVHIASTRNPNQIYDLAPVSGVLPRTDMPAEPPDDQPLVPIGSHFYPGCLYIHDLAMIDGTLHANAVGQNAVVRLTGAGRAEQVWWPRAIEGANGPLFTKNYLQLNSIAAGQSLQDSFFSASAEQMSARRPGHRNFPVDRRGVIFAGATREPIVRGLTRPHSARLHREQVWVDNSGYGELGYGEDGRFVPVRKLPGWTRGLCFVGDLAFVGTSRVIPRFRHYAPGLDVASSVCGVHAFNTRTGDVIASLTWPHANQIFAIEWLPDSVSGGFPFRAGRRATTREKKLFYSFTTTLSEEDCA